MTFSFWEEKDQMIKERKAGGMSLSRGCLCPGGDPPCRNVRAVCMLLEYILVYCDVCFFCLVASGRADHRRALL